VGSNQKHIVIIGSGPSALIAATFLSKQHSVTIYEKNKGIGNKFLIAGKGGLNITNSLVGEKLLDKYIPIEFMKDAILSFDSTALRKWFSEIGVETYVGTSGRVFPEKGIKPADVLNRIKEKLLSQKVNIKYQTEFVGFDEEENIKIKSKGEAKTVVADYYLFALGGASWSTTGSDGKWIKYFENIGVNTIPFESSNCGVNIEWSENIIQSHQGKPLKNISISVGNSKLKGEAIITKYGLEGNVIYPLIPKVRELLKNNSITHLIIDFKPENSITSLQEKIINKKVSSKDYGKIFNLNREQLSIIKNYSTKEEFLSTQLFIEKIKETKIKVESLRDIEEAISTIGGIDTQELNKNFSLKKHSKIYCIGEMVNWDAPTGGFLLQGAFSMGFYSAQSIIQFIHTQQNVKIIV
jgi:uncharacterized flavoprotein (TIGR03862 family)